jgi:CRP-like cAMP-binding protein
MSEQLIKKLQEFQLFESMHANSIQKLLDRGVLRNFEEGEYLTRESEVGDTVYFILKGRIDVLISKPHKTGFDHIVTLKEGNIVGESVLIGRKRRVADTIVKSDAEVYTWTKDDLLSLFDENPVIGYSFMKNIAYNIADKLEVNNQSLRNLLNNINLTIY